MRRSTPWTIIALAATSGLALSTATFAGYNGRIGGTGFKTGGVPAAGEPTPAGKMLLDKIKADNPGLTDMQARAKAAALHEGVCKAIDNVKKHNATVGACLAKLKKKGSLCISFNMRGAYGTAINDGKAACNENDKININAKIFAEGCPPPYDPKMYWLTTTLLHEGTHATQDYEVDTTGMTPEEGRAARAKRRMCNEAGTGTGGDPKGAHVIENEWIEQLQEAIDQLNSATPMSLLHWSDATQEIFNQLFALAEPAKSMAIMKLQKAIDANKKGNDDAIECYRKGKMAMDAFIAADKSTPAKLAMALQALRMALNQAKWQSTISRFFDDVESPKTQHSNATSGIIDQPLSLPLDTGMNGIFDHELLFGAFMIVVGQELPGTGSLHVYVDANDDGFFDITEQQVALNNQPNIPPHSDIIVHPDLGTVLLYDHDTSQFHHFFDTNFDEVPDQLSPPIFGLPGADPFLQQWDWHPNGQLLMSSDIQDSMRPMEQWDDATVVLQDTNGDGIPDADLGMQPLLPFVDFAPTWAGSPIAGDNFMDIYCYAGPFDPIVPFSIDVFDPVTMLPIENLAIGNSTDPAIPTNVALTRPLIDGELVIVSSGRFPSNPAHSPALQVTPCVGTGPDINGDEFIDGADLAALLANWGSSNPCTDFTGDGITDGADLAILLASWGVRLEFP